MKLLITSVGSLVGQNILDVLDYSGYSRRAQVEVIGANSVPDSPSNFRCDRCYLVPDADTVEFSPRFEQILLEEVPDLILCGRDEDTVVLSQLKAARRDLPGVLTCDNPDAATIAFDKHQTALFALKHGLPFAESLVPETAGREASVIEFCERVGYPVVAKPVRGSGSRGVFFLRDEVDARTIARHDGFMFQEYLGEPEELVAYFETLVGVPPLFVQAPVPGHYSCQAVVAPTSDVSSLCVMYNHHEYGHTVWNSRVSDATLDALALTYVEKLIGEGARGPINVQCRRDRRGEWKVQEVNLRNTGSTLSRFLLGWDELFLIVRDFVPCAAFPAVYLSGSEKVNRVTKRYFAYPIPDDAVAALKARGVWSR